MSKQERQAMDDRRVHAVLVADGLDMGMSGAEALDWANLRMKSIQGDGIRLGLAVDDLKAAMIEPLAKWVARQAERVSR